MLPVHIGLGAEALLQLIISDTYTVRFLSRLIHFASLQMVIGWMYRIYG